MESKIVKIRVPNSIRLCMGNGTYPEWKLHLSFVVSYFKLSLHFEVSEHAVNLGTLCIASLSLHSPVAKLVEQIFSGSHCYGGNDIRLSNRRLCLRCPVPHSTRRGDERLNLSSKIVECGGQSLSEDQFFDPVVHWTHFVCIAGWHLYAGCVVEAFSIITVVFSLWLILVYFKTKILIGVTVF